MRKIILTALGCACLALLLGWLVTAQANASSSNDSASLLIVLVSIPLLLASVVFSFGASWVLRSAQQRQAHGITTLAWRCAFALNLLLSLAYLTVFGYLASLLFR
ncbi:hypothetical protein [Aliidiomarina haloalkalitolerans]|uniref:Uncharacterized protein n=1 Tax=Aliidiomarina haloalkalitolerans TaxID=859059 RepID=A0A432VV03_9GAMM|nr:hypothetical protein [Aliidiomarina haloalkalitolerans]RUO20208.1 hypothetical protein CWE06_06165 [Aliidiomarina haloalkalitolerans]